MGVTVKYEKKNTRMIVENDLGKFIYEKKPAHNIKGHIPIKLREKLKKQNEENTWVLVSSKLK